MTIIVDRILEVMVQHDGSDLHCKVGSEPRIRINGELRPLDVSAFTEEDINNIILQLLYDDKEAFQKYQENREYDFAYQIKGTSNRFRVNIYYAKNQPGIILRKLSSSPPTASEIGLPEILTSIALEPRGLILVTGPTGSGKTTTLAAMLNHINESKRANIVTIEDPIEIIHSDKKSFVVQREIGTDTKSFENAMRAVMRQDPDVMLIGEMRDAETVKAALQAAETGHLVLSTLHTIDAEGTINRIIEFFEPREQHQIRLSLADSLRGIISQRLVQTLDNKRTAAFEILTNNGRIQEKIIDPSNSNESILEIINSSGYYGMQSFDQHLINLVLEQKISVDTAVNNSTRPQDLFLVLRQQGIVE